MDSHKHLVRDDVLKLALGIRRVCRRMPLMGFSSTHQAIRTTLTDKITASTPIRVHRGPAFSQDAIDNRQMLAKGGKISMLVLAPGAEKSFGTGMTGDLRFVASKLTDEIVPNSGHWFMEENPQDTMRLVTDFLRNSEG